MRLNGRELTEKEIEQCIADHNLDGAQLNQKYKLSEGGEHPIITKETYEGAKHRVGVCGAPFQNGYHQWVWIRLAMIANGDSEAS